MLKIQTKLTSQSQVSIPAAVRRMLGLTPGATVEWLQDGNRIVVKRAARSTSVEAHQALFPEGTSDRVAPGPAKTQAQLKQGIAQRMQRKYGKTHAGD